MNTVYVMTGNERSPRARQVNNFERTRRIKSLKKPQEYESNLLYQSKKDQSGYQTIDGIMS